MLTIKGLGTLGSAINFGHFLGFSPFTYYNTHLALPPKKYRQSRFSFSVCINFTYSFYTLSKLLMACLAKTEGRKYSELFWLGIYTTGQFWGFTDMIFMWFKRHQIICFFNSMVEFSKRIISHGFQVKTPNSKFRQHVDIFQIVIIYLRICILFVSFCSTAMFVVNTSAPQFAYSSISSHPAKERPKIFPNLILFIILEYYHKLGLQSAIIIETLGILIMYIMFCSWILSQIQCNKKIKGSIKHYRSVHILSKLHQDSIGPTLSMVFVSFGIMWILGVIGTIRLYNIVDILDYCILCVLTFSGSILLGIIHFCGNIPKTCRMTLTDFRHNYNPNVSNRERKYLTKVTKGLQLFGIRCAPIRLLKHNAIYLYFGSLINMIVTALVAHQDLGKA